MMTLCIIFTIVFILLIVYIIYYCKDSDEGTVGFVLGIIFAYLAICTIILYSCEFGNKEPNAIDVYRGNTTLEITYKDSIPVDTIVVFKNE